MSETITESELLGRFQQLVKSSGGQRAFARAHGITPSYVNDLVNSRRKISESILSIMGIERVVTVTYQMVEKPTQNIEKAIERIGESYPLTSFDLMQAFEPLLPDGYLTSIAPRKDQANG